MQGALQFQDSGFVVSHQGLAMLVLEGCTQCWEPAPTWGLRRSFAVLTARVGVPSAKHGD